MDAVTSVGAAGPRRGALRGALAAGLASSAAVAVARVVMLPLYLHRLGMEAYALIGLYLALQAVLQVFDFGLSPTMSRQLARASVDATHAGAARDFVRTVEIGYGALGVVLGAVILFSAPWTATHWLHPEHLAPETVRMVIVLMGLLTALEWPLTLYQGALLGLERQVALGAVTATITILTSAGAALLLFVAPGNVVALFEWLAAAGAIHVVSLRVMVWRALPVAPMPAHWSPAVLRDSRAFAAGVSGIMLIAAVLTQLDKLLLSRLVPLGQLGVYSVASVAATSLGAIVAPVFNAVHPRFAALAARNDREELARVYHLAARLVAAALAPVAVLMIVFAPQLLTAWTGDGAMAAQAAPLLRVLTVGTLCSGLMFVPYAVQLAYGWTGLYIRAHLVLIAAYVPLVLLLTPRYGMIVPALGWAGVNLAWSLVALPATHRRYLPSDGTRWLWHDTLPSLAAAGATAGLSWAILRQRPASPSILSLALIAAATLAASALATRLYRRSVPAPLPSP